MHSFRWSILCGVIIFTRYYDQTAKWQKLHFWLLYTVNDTWMQHMSHIFINLWCSDPGLLDEEHALWVRLLPPCWPVYSIHGSVDRLQRQLGWHSRAFPVSPCCYTEMCVLEGGGHKSPPLIIRPRCLLPLQAPGSWLDSFVAKSNLRDRLGIPSGYRKQGHCKRQTTTQLYTWHIAGWAVKATQSSPKQKCDLH